MNRLMKILVLVLVLIFSGTSVVAAADYKSFVDEMVYAPFLFEEDPADEFLAEKQEINRLYREHQFDSVSYEPLLFKIEKLMKKEVARYGEKYADFEAILGLQRAGSLYLEKELAEHLQSIPVEDIRDGLRDENNLQEFESSLNEATSVYFFHPELLFSLDKIIIKILENALGEEAPVTLKHRINLIQDYSVLGDSKVALEMSKDLLPKVEAAFGFKSPEAAAVLNLMAYDYKTLGNYYASEETLFKLVALNKELHGEESSLALAESLFELIKLRQATPVSDPALYDALKKAAKNLPNEDFYENYTESMNEAVVEYTLDDIDDGDLWEFYSKEYRRNFLIKFVDTYLEISNLYRTLGFYSHSLTSDIRAMNLCTMSFRNYHHKTLKTFCNLSDDYLRLNQSDNALTLAQMAFEISQKTYGEEHPCTVYAIHSLTNVYRKIGRYDDALELDKKAYALCDKVFVKCSVGEPQETLTALMDIADDFRGMKNYPEAIKHYEGFLAQYSTSNVNVSKITEARKNLAYSYNATGEYEKTVQLYSFLLEDEDYSLDKLKIKGALAAHTANVLGEALAAIDEYDDVYFNTDATGLYYDLIDEFEDLRDDDQDSLFEATFSTNGNRREWLAQNVPYYKKAASFFVHYEDNNEAFRAVELCKGRTLAEQYNELLSMYTVGLSEDEMLKLNEYRKKITQYENNFSGKLQSGSNASKFNMMFAQIKAISEYNSYRQQLDDKYPEYYKKVNSILMYLELFQTEQVKALIPRDCCYISYSVVKEDEASNTRVNEILAFVVDDNGEIKSFSIAVDEEFFAACNLYRDLLQYPNLNSLNRAGKYLRKKSKGGYILTETSEPLEGTSSVKTAEGLRGAKEELSAQLGEKLLTPLAEYISTKTTWIISPDGELNTIPFETLQFNGKMAIESADICYVPSLAVLKLMKEAGDKNRQLSSRRELFAMGNAVYGEFGEAEKRGNDEIFAAIQRSPDGYVDLTQLKWKNLEGTGKELEKVSAFFSSNTQKMITGSEASERNLKQLDKNGELAQYKLILLAAHGLFIPERPDLNAIVLSQIADAENDGYVTVGEWMGYKLNSDLVYLSACESGRGDYRAGEGIIGLPYALTIAGNKDTVMSLWEVDDTATAEFTSAVFEKLSRGVPEVRALNETKREFMKNPSANLNSSSVWAAFLLYGF